MTVRFKSESIQYSYLALVNTMYTNTVIDDVNEPKDEEHAFKVEVMALLLAYSGAIALFEKS